ncbi:MAG TPA: alpha-galactosidase [Candidatus Limnocylindrales bacterium]|nr:alpha-galactosidase [Candidatus Limnocylindrales bacterium]
MPVHANEHGWVLETEHSAYALGLNAQGLLVSRFWGARLPNIEDYPPPRESDGWASFNGPGQLLPEEFPAYGGVKYIEPCLKVTFADGVRDTVLRFERASLLGEELRISLRDAHYPLRVTLIYTAHPAYDLIERRAEVTNDGDTPVTIERVFSAQWHPPAGTDYRLSHLTGRWLDEFHLQRELLTPGVKVLESRRITTSHHHNPWFALDDGGASEDSGEVRFGVLAWSGNWKLAAEMTDFQMTRLSIGLNDWDFAWSLGPGETFATPPSLAGYTASGFGAASRCLHAYLREQVVPHPGLTHKVLYNSWEATFFDVDEPSQAKLAELAAVMGVELFVMDDGWFRARNGDTAGLGDWSPDTRKFPNGLTPLIDRVKGLGMDFGLWVEPEMVNPDSDLYRAHPDWAIHFPTRERTTGRNQLILNLGRTDVQDYLIAQLDGLLTDHDIRFIKWDMNRNVSEPGWPDAPGDARELWVRYVQGVYRVWGTLCQRHPAVVFQSCSGGGGRADAAILRLADQIWVSDNTEAAARLGIQEGFSQVFPASTMEAWVTDMNPNHLSLEFRFHVSMCGVLGIGGNLLKWTGAERAEAAELIRLYKDIRPIVQAGDQYRLRSAQGGAFSAVQYMAKERGEGVLLAFRSHLPMPAQLPPLRLRGLDPAALYTVEGFEGTRSGAAWMADGLRIELLDFQSTLRRIRQVAARS